MVPVCVRQNEQIDLGERLLPKEREKNRPCEPALIERARVEQNGFPVGKLDDDGVSVADGKNRQFKLFGALLGPDPEPKSKQREDPAQSRFDGRKDEQESQGGQCNPNRPAARDEAGSPRKGIKTSQDPEGEFGEFAKSEFENG